MQQGVLLRDIVVTKLKGEDNIADALTKPVDGKLVSEHLEKVGSSVHTDRHRLAPLLDVVEENWEGEGRDGEGE